MFVLRLHALMGRLFEVCRPARPAAALVCAALACCHPHGLRDAGAPPGGDVDASAGTSYRTVDGGPKARTAAAPAAQALSIQGKFIALRRDALGTLFELRPQYIEVTNTPRVQLGAMKLVVFSQHGDTLAMMEPALHALYGSLPTSRLLQTFTIVQETAEQLLFAWPTASGSLFLREPASPADLAPLVRQYTAAAEPLLPLADGVLLNMTESGSTVTLQHVVASRGEMPASPLAAVLGDNPPGAVSQTTFHTTLTLRPYADNPSYVPKGQAQAAPPHYLQVARGKLHASDVDYLAMTWDAGGAAGPIVYDIAADVPPELVEAIADGVLYWNRAAGRELTAVARGQVLSTLSEPRHVPIRWIPWHRPGAASIAEMQPDPLTGEIVAAEIYLTSAFYEPSPHLLAHATTMARPQPPSSVTCMAPRIATPTLLDVLGDGADKVFLQRAMADNIRSVVAHEVGHTLGLRHNFAASLEGAQDDRRALWHDYSAGHAAGAAVASSVMDYLPDTDSIILGAFIKHTALPYDAWVMRQGYGTQGWDMDAISPQLFCSDGERLGGILGCRQFDSSPNPFRGALAEATEAMRHLPVEFVLLMTEQGHTPLTEAVLLRKLALLRPEVFALPVAMVTQELFNGLRPSVRVLPVERRLGHLRHSEPLAYHQAGLEMRRAWLEEVGGLPGLLQALLGAAEPWDGQHSDQTLGWMARGLQRFIDRGPLMSGTTGLGAGDNAGPVDDAGKLLLHRYGPKWVAAIEHAVLTDVLLTLTGEGPKVGRHILAALSDPLSRADNGRSGLDPALVDPAWQDDLCGWAEALILADGADVIHVRDAAGPDADAVDVLGPALPLQTRLAALRLMAPEVFHVTSWGKAHRERLMQALLQRLFVLIDPRLLQASGENGQAVVRSLGLASFEELMQLPSLPANVQLWAQDELQLLKVLATLNATKRLPVEPSMQAQLLGF